MFPELDEGFAVLFVILSLSAGCLGESMDIFHAISLLQPFPCPGRVEMSWKTRSYGWMAQKSGEVMLLQTCLAVTYLLQSSCFGGQSHLYGGQIRTFHCKTRNSSVFDGWLQLVLVLLSFKSPLTVIALYLLWILSGALWGLHRLWTALESHAFWLWQHFLKQSSSQAVTRAH